jgi:excisionase family DNA binding protein
MKEDPVQSFDKMSTAQPAKEVCTIRDVAELFKISVTGVRRLQQGRHLPFIKVGGRIRFYKKDIIAYLDKRRVESID